MVLSASTLDALVKSAGAAINDRAANGLCANEVVSMSVMGFDTVQMCFRSQEERPIRDRGRSHESVRELVRRQYFERAPAFEDRGGAVLAEKIQPSVGIDWRGREIPSNAFGPAYFSFG